MAEVSVPSVPSTDEYIVSIQDKRIYKKKFLEFLVVWDNGQNSWEPFSYVPIHLIEQFDAMARKKEERKKFAQLDVVDDKKVDGEIKYLVVSESYEKEENIDKDLLKIYSKERWIVAEKRKRDSDEAERKILSSPNVTP